ncbi:MAG: hypothetical protein H6925_04525 [Holosporaceae bacterium]|nr:MAG: hypothetical protein H6925_04525 [Holosporaceae bacterium]
MIFAGTLRAPTGAVSGDFVLLVFDGGTAARRTALDTLLSAERDPAFMAVLYPERVRDDADRMLEWGDKLPHIDRCTGSVTLPSVRRVGARHHVGGDFFRDSLTCIHHDARWGGVHCVAEAQWVQRFDGVTALGPMIQGGTLETLTPEALKRRWWGKETPLRRTGYEVLKSDLSVRETLPEGGVTKVDGRDVPVPMARMTPTLTVGWHYRQKRVEVAEIIMNGTTSAAPVCPVPVRLQDISSRMSMGVWHAQHPYKEGVRVQHGERVYRAHTSHVSGTAFAPQYWQAEKAWPTALEKPHSWTFFDTPFGTRVVDALVGWSERVMHISAAHTSVTVSLPFEAAAKMHMGDRVVLDDPRLEDGTFEGTVEEIGLYAEGDVGELWGTLTLRTPLSKVRLCRQKMQLKGPVGGVQHPERLTAKDVLVNCVVHNDGAAQKEALAKKKFAHRGAVRAWLDQHATRVMLRLRNLAPDAQLIHGWQVDVG